MKVNDPLAIGGATLLLFACALMTRLIPARRPDRGLAHGIASSLVPRLWLSAPGSLVRSEEFEETRQRESGRDLVIGASKVKLKHSIPGLGVS